MIKYLLFFLVAFTIPALSIGENITQSTTGDKSNIFSNITGDISINYNLDNKKPTKIDAIKIIEKSTSEGIGEIKFLKWIDLDDNKSFDLLFVSYFLESYFEKPHSRNQYVFSDLFLITDDYVIRIYHDSSGQLSEFQHIAIGHYNGEKHLFIYSFKGNRGYLEGILYKLDILNQLTKVFTVDPGLSGSDVYSIQGNIVIESSGKIFIITYIKNSFYLKRYNKLIKYPYLGINKHILNITDCNSTNSYITFDNIEIPDSYLYDIYDYFQNNKNIPEKYYNNISLNDEIIIISNKSITRLMIYDSNLNFSKGIHITLIANKRGESGVGFICGYERDIYIPVSIE